MSPIRSLPSLGFASRRRQNARDENAVYASVASRLGFLKNGQRCDAAMKAKVDDKLGCSPVGLSDQEISQKIAERRGRNSQSKTDVSHRKRARVHNGWQILADA